MSQFNRSESVTQTQTGNTMQIKIRDVTITAEKAQTDSEKMKGLGERDSLPEDGGMIFLYDQPQQWSFWMKGMRFALDFIWINSGKVADLSENVLPPSQTNNIPQVISPRVPVQYILEVNAGWIKKHNIQIGDVVTFEKP